MDRRKFIVKSGTLGVIGISGCLNFGDSDDDAPDTTPSGPAEGEGTTEVMKRITAAVDDLTVAAEVIGVNHTHDEYHDFIELIDAKNHVIWGQQELTAAEQRVEDSSVENRIQALQEVAELQNALIETYKLEIRFPTLFQYVLASIRREDTEEAMGVVNKLIGSLGELGAFIQYGEQLHADLSRGGIQTDELKYRSDYERYIRQDVESIHKLQGFAENLYTIVHGVHEIANAGLSINGPPKTESEWESFRVVVSEHADGVIAAEKNIDSVSGNGIVTEIRTDILYGIQTPVEGVQNLKKSVELADNDVTESARQTFLIGIDKLT